jgi:hypothetical protein
MKMWVRSSASSAAKAIIRASLERAGDSILSKGVEISRGAGCEGREGPAGSVVDWSCRRAGMSASNSNGTAGFMTLMYTARISFASAGRQRFSSSPARSAEGSPAIPLLHMPEKTALLSTTIASFVREEQEVHRQGNSAGRL